PGIELEEVKTVRVDRHLDRFARLEEEVPVEAAEECRRPSERFGLGRLCRGVDELCSSKRRRRDLEMDEVLRAEGLDEQYTGGELRRLDVGAELHVLGPNTESDRPPDMCVEARSPSDDFVRQLEIGAADPARARHLGPPA